MNRLLILVLGNTDPEQLSASYRRAFEALGHKVIHVDMDQLAPRVSASLRTRVGYRLTKRSATLGRLAAATVNRRLLALVRERRPDLFFTVNGDFLTPGAVRAIKEAGTPVFIFHADNPLPPHRANRPETIPAALAADRYFIWSQTVAGRLDQLGVRARYLPFAWDPIVFPYEPRCPMEHDVVFIGGWDPEREEILERVAAEFDLKIWGPPYWATRTKLGSRARDSWQGRAVRGPEAATIIARSKIALNILRDQNLPDGTNMRTFEVPGAGGFALATYTPGTDAIFPDRRSGAFFRTALDLLSQIERYLPDEETRVSMAQAAHGAVAREHRYVDRTRQILGELETMGRGGRSA